MASLQELGLVSRLRVGFGYDIHSFEEGLPLVLGGVEIESGRGLSSTTDGDAVCHAIIDALLSACGLPDIGTLFPPDDETLLGANSLLLLQQTMSGLRKSCLGEILNLSLTVLTEEPKLSPHRAGILSSLARAMQLEPERIAIAAGTNERFDAVGRGEALVAFAHVLLLLAAPEKAAGKGRNMSLLDELDQPTGASAGPADIEAAVELESLAPRAREFERAVLTRLPPLPRASEPRAGEELILYTDGASRGNPGPAACGWVLFNAQGLLVHEEGKVLGEMTNNEAEYAALKEALSWIELRLGTSFGLILRMDSELIVKQLRGEYRIKAENLRQTALLVMSQLAAFNDLRIEHVPRAQNSRADALANQALDAAGGKR